MYFGGNLTIGSKNFPFSTAVAFPVNKSSTGFQVSCFGGVDCFGTVELTESYTLASSKVLKDTVGAFGGTPKRGMGLVTVRGASGTSSYETSGPASCSSSELSSLVASS